jgi:hypothetical protein
VLLLRRAGHTARCVAGFASEEFDDRGVVFRGLHAHAWIEVVNAEGRWQRFDPTPTTARNGGIMANIDLNKLSNGEGIDPQPQALTPIDKEGQHSFTALATTWWPLLVLVTICAGFIVLLIIRRVKIQAIRDPRLAELQRRNDDLVRLALALGVPVKPATTLSDVANALEQRTGVDLHHHLDAHLAARFGNGPLPEPWPIDVLKNAARSKRAPVHANTELKL